MARGGKRQGAPGQAYSNRSDLMTDYSAPASAMPGPVAAQAAQRPDMASAAQPPAGFPSPDQTPFLDDPDQQPGVLPGYQDAATSGGPSALRDLQIIKNYLPEMREQAANEDTPPTFKAFVRWLEQQ